MPSVKMRGNSYQLRVVHRLLPKPFYHSFEDETEAINYGEQLEAMLARGIVPQELLAVPKTSDDPLLPRLISAYCDEAHAITESDDRLLGVVMCDSPVIGLRLSGLTYRWVETYVAWLKSTEMNIAPSSIRKRIGALGRVMDWRIKRTTADNAAPMVNVVRLLPRLQYLYAHRYRPAPARYFARSAVVAG
jgi:hypothetical protein